MVQEVERLIRLDGIQMLGPIHQEILSGARPQERFTQFKECLRFYPDLPLDDEDDENAARAIDTPPSVGCFLILVAASLRWKQPPPAW